MPSNTNDNLSECVQGWTLDDREVVWLWLFLTEREGISLNDCSLNSSTMRDQIAHELRYKQELRANLTRARETTLLPDQAFDWVEKIGRQPKWLIAQATKKTGLRVRSSVFRTLSFKPQLIAIFDLWDADFSRKEGFLRKLASDWSTHLQTDKVFLWFKGQDGPEKYSLAWGWLEKNKPELTSKKQPFTQFGGLLEFFDGSGASPDEKGLYVDKIKRRWSTRKTREKNSHKKQYNFELTNTVNASLDKLAQAHQLSRTKVIEKLILSETARKLYLAPE